MFLLAWSLVDSVVKYTRQRHIKGMLTRYFFSPYSQQTIIVCRRLYQKLSNGAIFESLNRGTSEPSVSNDNLEVMLYRVEDREVVATTHMEHVRISDWSLSLLDSNCVRSTADVKKPRIAFVVHLSKIVQENSDERLSESSMAENGSDSSKPETYIPDSNTPQSYTNLNVNLSDLAVRIAFRKDKPTEVLYECEIEQFYEIVFHWSENCLLDFDGRAIVDYLWTIRLPRFEDIKSHRKWHVQSLVDVSLDYSSNQDSSLPTSSKSSDVQQPHSLLELLYFQDLLGEYQNDPRGRISIKKGCLKYRSDLTLNKSRRRDLDRPLTRNSWSSTQKLDGMFYQDDSLLRRNPLGVKSANTSIRYRSCSPISMNSGKEERPNIIKLETFLLNPTQTRTLPSEVFMSPYLRNLYGPSRKSITYSSVGNGIDKLHKLENAGSNLDRSKIEHGCQEVRITSPNKEIPTLNDDMEEEEDRSVGISTSITEKSLESIDGSTESLKEDTVAPVKPKTRFSTIPVNISNKRLSTDENIVKNSLFQEFSRRRSVSPMLANLFSYAARQEFMNSLDGSRRFSTKLFSRDSFSKSRRFRSTPRNVQLSYSTMNSSRLRKPHSILIFTSDDMRLFNRIQHCLGKILPANTYTIASLSSESFLQYPWVDDKPVCLILTNTSNLNDICWSRIQAYFVHSGKIVFLCQNSLLASLSNCKSRKAQTSILKNAFGHRSTNSSLGKDFERFLKKGVKLMSKHKDVHERFYAKDIVGGGSYSVVFQKKDGQPLLLYMENSEHKASALFSDATTDQILAKSGTHLINDAISRLGIEVRKECEPVKYSFGYLIAIKDRLLWNMKSLSYGEYIGDKKLSLYLQPSVVLLNGFDRLPEANPNLLPIEVRRNVEGLPNETFDSNRYFETLQTKLFGHILLYVPVCSSTMDVSKSFTHASPESNGLLVVTSCQIQGKGRGQNQWISVPGCAMFTLNISIDLDSQLGQKATFVQHIMAISVVDAVCTIIGDMDFPLKIKWPNDLYHDRNYKMGGILVNASVHQDKLRCMIGVGLNVSNSSPTVCVNDLLPDDSIDKLDLESVIGQIVNKFEVYVNRFENGHKDDVLRKYYKYWLHSDEEILVDTEGVKEKVNIRGLDQHGFLEVYNKQTQKTFSVHDTGNTFDIMKGLIRAKV